MGKTVMMFVVAMSCLMPIGCTTTLQSRPPLVEVEASSRFFVKGERDAIIGAINCTQVRDGLVHACGRDLEIVALPLKVSGFAALENVRLVHSLDRFGWPLETETVATVKLDRAGRITQHEQLKPWNGRVLYVVADIAPDAEIAIGGQFQTIGLMVEPTLRDGDGSLFSPSFVSDRHFRNAIVRHEVSVGKDALGPRSFQYRIQAATDVPVATKIHGALWRSHEARGKEFAVADLACRLNGVPVVFAEFSGDIGAWSGDISIRNGDIIQCDISNDLDISDYVLDLGTFTASDIAGHPAAGAEVVKLDYQDRARY